MKKLSLILCCLFALTACDSTSINSGATSGDAGVGTGTGNGAADDSAENDAGAESDDGASDGSEENDAGTDSGEDAENEEGTEETDSGSDSETEGDASSCIAPTHGNVFTDLGTTVLTDGCINGGVLSLSESSTTGSNQILIPGQFESDYQPGPANKKGLYLYKEGGAPAYILVRRAVGSFQRAGRLGFVTGGSGMYYLPFLREANNQSGLDLNGLAISTWSAIPGQAVSLTEVTWADVSDDVSALPKLHWQDLDVSDSNSAYDSRNLLTQAASAQPLRELTHILAKSVTTQYIDLTNGVCPAEIGGFSERSAIRFTDATGELGQAWSARDINISTADDLARPIYSIAIDWDYASNATISDILDGIDGAGYLWPDPARNLNCTGQIIVSTDFDSLRPSALNGSLGSASNSVWNN